MPVNAPLRAQWSFPTRMLVGPGRIAELPALCREIGLERPLLVTDRGLAGHAMVRSVLDGLAAAGLPAAMFSDVQGNPLDVNVEHGVAAFRTGGHDSVIALGGGSALDVGKLVALMVGQQRPIWDFEDIGDWWTRADAAAIKPILAIPTTAGTGSEVGRAAVVTNGATHEKKIIFHPRMLPAAVIADAELCVGLPPHLTAATGMDAFTHCFEAYCVDSFHPMADGIALEGMRLIQAFLPRAVRQGDDLLARSRMLAAASMGAVAFQKGLGAVHSLAHPLSALFDTHHGLGNAVLLPYVMVFNRSAIATRMPLLARVLALPGDGFDAVLDWLLEFRRELGIPHALSDLGIDHSRAPEIALQAQRDPSTASNPRPTTVDDMQRIFTAAVAGDLQCLARTR